jgi:XisH protein
MPARDFFHEVVRRALEKDGWTITADPLRFNFFDFALLLDLGAERLIRFERGTERIAVEIKGFGNASRISDFHATLGQYQNYQAALELRDPERRLYLAIPEALFDTFSRTNSCNTRFDATRFPFSFTIRKTR